MGMSMGEDELGVSAPSLTAAERRVRAGQIRDAAAAAGIEQGWLLAGIADAETNMSHCWSELTWACMGPNSDDCGGGPVVAGRWDGPCSDRQGGLGMFQFDAGTYEDTLRREGERILSIAGNTQAAVDFVVAMVIRSVYISGVGNREQALAWMNRVRIDNSLWDAWIRTVTHYYNGCSPSASCFTSRYAHYRDRTRNVFAEMGAEFWEVSSGPEWAARYVIQTFPLASDPFPLEAGAVFEGYLEMRNTGSQTWRPFEVFLATTEPRNGASPIADETWISPSRPATIDREVPPGATGRFELSVRAPEALGEYPQYFNLLREGVAWFSESGGPADNVIQIRVQSVAPTAVSCPDGIDETLRCEGNDRVRCEGGRVFRQICALGCIAGECSSNGSDAGMMSEPHDAGAWVQPERDAATSDPQDASIEARSRDAIEESRDGRWVGGCSIARTSATRAWGMIPSLIMLGFISRRRGARSRKDARRSQP